MGKMGVKLAESVSARDQESARKRRAEDELEAARLEVDHLTGLLQQKEDVHGSAVEQVEAR